jgi:nicotinamidase-related amidase
MIDQTRTNGSMLDKANAAFEQAAAKVIERARQTGTPVVVWQDDHVKEVTPEQFTENRKRKTESNG